MGGDAGASDGADSGAASASGGRLARTEGSPGRARASSRRAARRCACPWRRNRRPSRRCRRSRSASRRATRETPTDASDPNRTDRDTSRRGSAAWARACRARVRRGSLRRICAPARRRSSDRGPSRWRCRPRRPAPCSGRYPPSIRWIAWRAPTCRRARRASASSGSEISPLMTLSMLASPMVAEATSSATMRLPRSLCRNASILAMAARVEILAQARSARVPRTHRCEIRGGRPHRPRRAAHR